MRKKNTPPKPYGRQAPGKTIRSVSIEEAVDKKVQKYADKHGLSFSAVVNGVLAGTIKISVLVATLLLAAHITRSPRNWSSKALKQTVVAAVSWSSSTLNHLSK